MLIFIRIRDAPEETPGLSNFESVIKFIADIPDPVSIPQRTQRHSNLADPIVLDARFIPLLPTNVRGISEDGQEIEH